MYTRTRLSNQVIKEVNKYFPDKIFKTIIPKNISLAEAPTLGKPIKAYDPMGKGALAYKELTKEIKENKNIMKSEYSVLPRWFGDFWDTGALPKHAIKK